MKNTTTLTGLALVLAAATSANAYIRITEVMSKAGSNDPTPDWFEISNYGSTSISLAGWKVDDNSFSAAAGAALNGITSINAGESVVFLEVNRAFTAAQQAQQVADFRAFWGGLATVRVGTYAASGISFSSSGDGCALFNASATEVTRVTFGAATSARSFFWGYNAATGSVVPGYNAGVSSLGTIGTQISFQSVGSGDEGVNIGSLGTAINVPGPGALALAALAGLVRGRRK